VCVRASTAIPFYTGSGLTTVINFASLFLQSTINFILPLLIYIRALHWSKTHPAGDDHQPHARPESLVAGGSYLTIDNHAPKSDQAYGGAKSVIVEEGLVDVDDTPAFRALPSWLMPYATGIAYALIVVIILLVALVVALNVYQIIHDNV
jgi:hypothetical protein